MPDQKKDQKLIDPTNITTGFMAEVLGLSRQRITQLFSEGTIKQNGKTRGRYDITEAIPQYVGSLRQGGTASAKTRLAVQQERKLSLLNDREAGILVRTADVAELFLASCIALRSGASALPRRLATRLANAKRATDVRHILTDELNGLLSEFEKPLRAYCDPTGQSVGNGRRRTNGAHAPTRKNAGPVGKRRKNITAGKRRTRKV